MKKPRGRLRAIQADRQMKRPEALLTPGTDETGSVKCGGDSKGVPGTIRVIFGTIHCDPMLSRNT